MGRQVGVTVVLRLSTAADLWLEEQLMSDPRMTIYLGGPETPAQIRRRHERFLHMNAAGPGRMFVIVVGPQQAAAGSVGFWETDWHGQRIWDAGWSVLPAYQGQGIATRATAAMVAHARAAGTHRLLHAFPSIENTASNAVCRKVGFVWRGEVDFEYPPGTVIRCNDWRLEVSPGQDTASAGG